MTAREYCVSWPRNGSAGSPTLVWGDKRGDDNVIFRNFLAGLSTINAVAKSIYAVAVVQQNGFITQFDNFHHRSGVFFLLFIFKLFFKHNDLVLGYWVQDLTEFCSYEPNSTKALKCQVSYITASPFMTLKVSRHSERSEESSQFSHTHYKISLDPAPSNLTQLRQQVAKFRISALPQDDVSGAVQDDVSGAVLDDANGSITFSHSFRNTLLWLCDLHSRGGP